MHSHRLGLTVLLAFTATIALTLALIAVPAHATPITFTFSGATATFGAVGTDDISGTFTYDGPTTTESHVSITVTGPQSAGTYTDVGPSDVTRAGEVILASDGNTLLAIEFVDPILTTQDALSLVVFNVGGTNIGSTTNVTGDADPVPEPTSLTLLSTALVGLGAIRQRRKRA